jgi:hypothetical protein
LIEKLPSILLTIVSLLERKHTSIQRMKEPLIGMKEKKRSKDEDKTERRMAGRGGWKSSDRFAEGDGLELNLRGCKETEKARTWSNGGLGFSWSQAREADPS